MAAFELRKSDDGHFSFILSDDDDKTLLKSEQYNSKASAQNGIESIRKNSVQDARYELKESNNGKFYFNLKATNGQIIGTSPLLADAAARDAAVAKVKAEAASASVLES
ncbi:YegP family protein [Neisseria sp. CCUG12390]|uniref:YegP family protein n=1 Tax=Neisseria sp. CCUG12390 TaxID=3392035 RepID=UPI003A0FB9F5